VYFRALANLQVSVTAVFPAACIHPKHTKSLKGWRKNNVEETQHFPGARIGDGIVVYRCTNEGAIGEFRID
jgi:hypothetical protein